MFPASPPGTGIEFRNKEVRAIERTEKRIANERASVARTRLYFSDLTKRTAAGYDNNIPSNSLRNKPLPPASRFENRYSALRGDILSPGESIIKFVAIDPSAFCGSMVILFRLFAYVNPNKEYFARRASLVSRNFSEVRANEEIKFRGNVYSVFRIPAFSEFSSPASLCKRNAKAMECI